MKAILPLILSLALGLSSSFGQLKINSNSLFKANGTIATNTTVNNLSVQTDLSTAQLTLLGSNQSITTTQPMLVSTLKVDQGGKRTITGDWEVSGTLQLVSGVISVGTNARLVYSGSPSVEGNSNSFVEGFLTMPGSGRKFFPVGVNDIYAPAVLEDSPNSEVAIRVVAGDASVALPEGISANFTGHYWELSNAVTSPVSLSLNGLGSFLDSARPVVLESSAVGATAQSLSGTFSGSFITSLEQISQPILLIGKAAEFSLVIHDLITPFTRDEINDKLEIENIDLTPDNVVKLIDRYGVLVKKWENYTNQTDYDFSQLSPGNYVCLVEYSYPGENTRQTSKGVVTILKSN